MKAQELLDRLKLLEAAQQRLAGQPGMEKNLAKVNQEIAGIVSQQKRMATDEQSYIALLEKEVSLRSKGKMTPLYDFEHEKLLQAMAGPQEPTTKTFVFKQEKFNGLISEFRLGGVNFGHLLVTDMKIEVNTQGLPVVTLKTLCMDGLDLEIPDPQIKIVNVKHDPRKELKNARRKRALNRRKRRQH